MRVQRPGSAKETVRTSPLLWEPFLPASTLSLTRGWLTASVQEVVQMEKTLEPKHPPLRLTCKKIPAQFKRWLLGYTFSLLHPAAWTQTKSSQKNTKLIHPKPNPRVMKWKHLCQFLSVGTLWLVLGALSYLSFPLQPRSWWFVWLVEVEQCINGTNRYSLTKAQKHNPEPNSWFPTKS